MIKGASAPNILILFYYIMTTMEKILQDWEVKDRTYLLNGNNTPLTFRVNTSRITLFDKTLKINRAVRYAPNQNSLFADEQSGVVRLEHVSFVDGNLFVPRSNPTLQILMSLMHPEAGKKWHELDLKKEAEDELAIIENEMEATQLAASMDLEHLEAIMRTELGSSVSDMSSKELKRDAYIFARRNPKLFVELANDEDIKLRNLANRVVEIGLVDLTDDNTVFKWASNSKKMFTVPFGDNPYAAFAQYLKTDEGADVMTAILKKID